MDKAIAILEELLQRITLDGVGDLVVEGRPARSAELQELVDRARQVLAGEQASAVSPFERHRATILGHYGTAYRLQKLVLALWEGNTGTVSLSWLAGVDGRHRAIALELIEHYSLNGERDEAFVALGLQLYEQARAETA